MEVRNCKGCGKIFNQMGSTPLCPECIKAMDLKFDEVKAYVYDHPNCTINQVAEEMDVSTNQIRKWIREERLAFSDSSAVGISCEGCGKQIKTGRYCETCKQNIQKGFNDLIPKKKEPELIKRKDDAGKMRFLG